MHCRYLTVREQKLRHRRKQVEELLAWKMKLDEEEAAIKRMEKEAMAAFTKKDDTGKGKLTGKRKDKEVSFKDNVKLDLKKDNKGR